MRIRHRLLPPMRARAYARPNNLQLGRQRSPNQANRGVTRPHTRQRRERHALTGGVKAASRADSARRSRPRRASQIDVQTRQKRQSHKSRCRCSEGSRRHQQAEMRRLRPRNLPDGPQLPGQTPMQHMRNQQSTGTLQSHLPR